MIHMIYDLGLKQRRRDEKQISRKKGMMMREKQKHDIISMIF